MTIMSDCGVAEFELEDAGTRINRMITFVGGATAENFLHQLRILYITACQTHGDMMKMKKVSIKIVSLFIIPCITLLGIYLVTMNKPDPVSFKQDSVHAVSLAGAETSLNFQVVDEKQ